jgi:DNA-binding SARP family transcriptional activator
MGETDGGGWQARVLGPAELCRGDDAPVRLTPRQRAIVATLALRDGRPCTTEQLIDAVWGWAAPSSARQSLQNQIARIRAATAPEVIAFGPAGYVLGCTTDADAFERTVTDALGREPGVELIEVLAPALADWRGSPYEDLADVAGADGERARLTELLLRAEEQLAASRLLARDLDTAVRDLWSMVATEPLREGRWAMLMTGLHAAGRTAEALDVFRKLCATLDDALGTEPSEELVDLRRRIADGDEPMIVDLRDRPAELASDDAPAPTRCTRRRQRRQRHCSSPK